MRIRSAATPVRRVTLPFGQRTISSFSRVALPEPEVDARILGREVAAPGLDLADESAAVGEHRRHDRAGRERARLTSSQWPERAGVAEQDQLAADRVDRDVHAPVVVVVRRGDPAAVDERRAIEPGGAPTRRRTGRRPGSRAPAPARASFFTFVTGIAPLARTRSCRPLLARSTHETPQPVSFSPTAARTLRCAFGERRAVRRPEGGVTLAARVGHEQVGPAVAAVVLRGDPHAGVGIGDAAARAPRSTKWKPSGPPGSLT